MGYSLTYTYSLTHLYLLTHSLILTHPLTCLGWPITFEDTSFQGSPMLYDIDGDGTNDIGVVDKDANLHWIRIGFTHSPTYSPLTHSLTHLLTHSLTHLLLLTHLLIPR